MSRKATMREMKYRNAFQPIRRTNSRWSFGNDEQNQQAVKQVLKPSKQSKK